MQSKRQECDKAWLDFDRQPGTRLVWVRTGILRCELRTAEQQTVASVRNSAFRGQEHLSAGGRSFTVKRVPRSWRPGIAWTISRDRSAGSRQMPPGGQANNDNEDLWPTAPWPSFQLLDEAGTPILYIRGKTTAGAVGYIKFPGRRFLQFRVRGTSRGNAIMTAVDQGLNEVARYRLVWNKLRPGVVGDITIRPDVQLTDELALAILLSAPWLSSSFERRHDLLAGQ